MTKALDNPFPSLLVQEAADDGLDFTNPAADYRRLFLGEDGLLHLKDSAGAVTDIGGGGGDITTDPAWAAAGDLIVGSGNDSASVLTKGAAGGVLAMGNSAVIWNAGTSFPASKATGDRYWRTDLDMEFFWDGTRWVTTQLFHGGSAGMASFTTGDTRWYVPLASQGGLDVWLDSWSGSRYSGGTNNGSHYWIISIEKFSDDLTIASINTSADTAGTLYQNTGTIGVVATEGAVYFNYAKSGTPTSHYPLAGFTYRLIAT